MSHAGLAIGTLAALQRYELDSELIAGLLEPRVGGVVEGLVATPSDVEHQADAERGLVGRRCFAASAAPEQHEREDGDSQRANVSSLHEFLPWS